MDRYLEAAITANNGKAIIINQPFGAGDLLFSEPIARKYHNEGYVVIWPVEDQFFWIHTYIDYVHFRRKSEFSGFDYELCRDDYKFEGILVLPLRFSNPLLRGLEPHDGSDRAHWMNDKYERLGLPVDMWKSLQWTRNEAKEDELYELMELDKLNGYAFINENFGGGITNAGLIGHIEVKQKAFVRMRPIKGFTMLDWAKVICNASEVHTVETSVMYMIEGLPCKADKFHLYPRKPETTLNQVKNIISTNKWILHEG